MSITLLHGNYLDLLPQIGQVQAVICDPPYGERTHKGHNSGNKQRITGQKTSQQITYMHWSPVDVARFISAIAPINTGWFACMTSHDLIDAYIAAYQEANLYAFPPVPVEQFRPRLLGDGPSSFGQYLVVARPRKKTYKNWGCIDAIYRSRSISKKGICGIKPVSLMQEVIRDYSRIGDLILDPFAGSASTLIAARSLGRRAIGCEISLPHYMIGLESIETDKTPEADRPELTCLGLRKSKKEKQ